MSALQFSPIPASQRPSFIAAADVQRYNQLYAALLGQVDSSAYMATRDGNLQPNPIGTGLITESDLSAYEFYAADTWQVSPTFTLNYGLTYNWQTPPTEKEGRQTLLTFRDTGQLVDPKRYLADKRAAAERGEVYNPALAYIPIKESGRSHAFDIDWTNVSPRISAAWTPSFTSGLTNRLFGDGKSVIRGGYSLLYDRSTTVQTITIPTLGVGFAQTLSANSPRNAAGQPFRVGVDGQIPVPVNTAAQSPIVPQSRVRRDAVVRRRSQHHRAAKPHGEPHPAARAARQPRPRARLHRPLRPQPVSEPQPEPGAVHVPGHMSRGRRSRRRSTRWPPSCARIPAVPRASRRSRGSRTF